jgi:hypothetical protein
MSVGRLRSRLGLELLLELVWLIVDGAMLTRTTAISRDSCRKEVLRGENEQVEQL